MKISLSIDWVPEDPLTDGYLDMDIRISLVTLGIVRMFGACTLVIPLKDKEAVDLLGRGREKGSTGWKGVEGEGCIIHR